MHVGLLHVPTGGEGRFREDVGCREHALPAQPGDNDIDDTVRHAIELGGEVLPAGKDCSPLLSDFGHSLGSSHVSPIRQKGPTQDFGSNAVSFRPPAGTFAA